jgi:hypothetical protein
MTFEEWLRTTCPKAVPVEVYDFAKATWEASEHYAEQQAVHDVLKRITGIDWHDRPFRHLNPKACHHLVDEMNKGLSGTGWSLMFCADGLAVRGGSGVVQELVDDLAEKVFAAM